MRPIHNDPLFVASIIIAAIVISAVIIGVIIFLVFFHVNLGTNNPNQQNFNTLNLIFNAIMRRQVPFVTS
jgi:hypothetical protein